ncbi:MAG: HlyD family efflux transporter periplasmic adaptor subunit [Clostridiales bacterium]|nr:HlyD family efflux transporter periplasmic adaptor subunit [Clostridiales bacterium]
MKKAFILIIIFVFFTSGCSGLKNDLILKGDIQNNIVSAVSTFSGKIIQFNFQQGEPVKKGDIIAVIDNTNQSYAVLQQQAIVNMKKAKLQELLAGTRPEQIEQAEAQVHAAKAQLDLLLAGNRSEQIQQGKINVSNAQESVNLAQITYDYNKTQYSKALDLFKSGALSQNDLDSAKLKSDTSQKQLMSAKLQLESAKTALTLLEDGSTTQSIEIARANLEAANAQLKLLKKGSTKQTIDAAKADVEQSVAQLNLANHNLKECNITAQNDGIIISKNYEQGDVVNIGSNIADIAVSNDLYVLCYIPDQYLDKIYYNQSLSVKTPTGTLTGRVSYIALKHEYTPKDKQSTPDEKHIATKVKVAITDEKGILKSGMTAEVSVSLKS